MACIPGAAELDLKALAKAAASKKAEMVHLKEVLALTGYQRGGCSPLGAKKEYPVFLDASATARAGAANRSCSRPPIWSVPSMRRRRS